jgi:hypothetical protein
MVRRGWRAGGRKNGHRVLYRDRVGRKNGHRVLYRDRVGRKNGRRVVFGRPVLCRLLRLHGDPTGHRRQPAQGGSRDG